MVAPLVALKRGPPGWRRATWLCVRSTDVSTRTPRYGACEANEDRIGAHPGDRGGPRGRGRGWLRPRGGRPEEGRTTVARWRRVAASTFGSSLIVTAERPGVPGERHRGLVAVIAWLLATAVAELACCRRFVQIGQGLLGPVLVVLLIAAVCCVLGCLLLKVFNRDTRSIKLLALGCSSSESVRQCSLIISFNPWRRGVGRLS